MELIYKHFSTLDSTNNWAKRHLSSFSVQDLTIISADEQTAGRGQYGKCWFSPKKKNIYASLCFFIPKEQKDSFFLIRTLSLSIKEYLEKYDVYCTLKWPNDLMVQDKKIAGILCEITPFSSYVGVIMGLGLNVNVSQKQLSTLDQPATSILIETKCAHDPKKLLEELAEIFAKNLFEISCPKRFQTGSNPHFSPTIRQL